MPTPIADHTVIEVAISGPGGKARNPNTPITPEEIAREIIACIDAGAAVVHNHCEDFSLAGSAAAARYGEGWAPALAARPDAILFGTLAANDGSELGGYSYVEESLRHGCRMGLLDPGSVNLCAGSEDGLPNVERQFAYVNAYPMLDRVTRLYQRLRLPATIAIYDPTFLRATIAYWKAGRLMPGTLVKLYFGGERSYFDGRPGVTFGLPPTIKALDAYLEMLEGVDLAWGAAVLGGDLIAERGLAEAVVARGGHLRVGLEDYGGDRTPRNVDLVAEAAELAARMGRPAASPSQAASILGMEQMQPAG